MTPEKFKQARQLLGFTQQQLADKIDMTVVMISYMENGKKTIEPRTIMVLWCLLYEAGIYPPGERLADQR